jgi:hypothetical protein
MVLSKPQPRFFQIKCLFPHCWLGLDNDRHRVTLEQFGEMTKNLHNMKDAGITPDEFAAHFVYLHEYWIKNQGTKTGRLHRIVDLKRVSSPLS